MGRMPTVVLACLAGALCALGANADEHPAPASPAHAATPARSPHTLDLRLGDLRRYLDPTELDTPTSDEMEEIVVRGQKLPPLPERREIPRALGAIIYSLQNPLQAWRILAPDPNVELQPRSEDDPREPPGAFRGKILEPGQIYD
jgi:hypothetical protein